nr:chemotaxis response regulator protein-glutamate methylesterase [Halorhodospira abdelmalekii]
MRVFLVDDSSVVRQVLSGLLGGAGGIEVIGSAADPLFALPKMERNWPDVIVLDIEMPRMDGITFLRHIMNQRPTPVVICSSLTERDAEVTVQALASGAVDVVTKPKIGLKDFLHANSSEIVRVVRAAGQVHRRALKGGAGLAGLAESVPTKGEISHNVAHNGGHDGVAGVAVAKTPVAPLSRTTDQVVACGTSTGGTQALEAILTPLPELCPGMVVVQHMPEKFTAAFARRLNGLCRCEVREAQENDRVMPGRVLIAPGGRHMLVQRSGAHYRIALSDGPPVNRHKPSVDVLFRSVAKVAGRNAVGVLMTGMGDDGANGLLLMRQAGARTIAQDQQSSVVFGMPQEAIKRGAAERVLSLREIAAGLPHGFRERSATPASPH